MLETMTNTWPGRKENLTHCSGSFKQALFKPPMSPMYFLSYPEVFCFKNQRIEAFSPLVIIAKLIDEIFPGFKFLPHKNSSSIVDTRHHSLPVIDIGKLINTVSRNTDGKNSDFPFKKYFCITVFETHTHTHSPFGS